MDVLGILNILAPFWLLIPSFTFEFDMAPSYKYQKVSDANSNEDLDFDNIDSRLKTEQSTYTKIDIQ